MFHGNVFTVFSANNINSFRCFTICCDNLKWQEKLAMESSHEIPEAFISVREIGCWYFSISCKAGAANGRLSNKRLQQRE